MVVSSYIVGMKICGIYKITSPTGKVYIGQSVDCMNRKRTYSYLQCKKQRKLLASLLKYGFDAHKFEVIHQCERDELPSLEKYYVDLHGTFNSEHGLNIRDGGGNRARISEEQKAKTSKTLTGKRHPPDRVAKNRAAQIGKKWTAERRMQVRHGNTRPNLGKTASLELRMKMSLARKGGSSWMKGKHHSEATRERLRELASGERNPNYGKPRDPETRRKIAESVRKAHAKRQQAARDSAITDRG